MADNEASLEAKLALLKKAYYEKLPGRIEEIAALWREMKAAWVEETAHTMHRLTHSIAGSGGTFGAIEITTTARKLEQIFKAVLQENRTPSDGEQIDAEQLLEELKVLAENPEGTATPSATSEAAPKKKTD